VFELFTKRHVGVVALFTVRNDRRLQQMAYRLQKSACEKMSLSQNAAAPWALFEFRYAIRANTFAACCEPDQIKSCKRHIANLTCFRELHFVSGGGGDKIK